MSSAKKFYGFSEEPFGLDPDPGFLFLAENHRKVLFSLQYGLTGKKGFVLLIGNGNRKATLSITWCRSAPIKVIPFFSRLKPSMNWWNSFFES
jgi:general secretion pathway protein A